MIKKRRCRLCLKTLDEEGEPIELRRGLCATCRRREGRRRAVKRHTSRRSKWVLDRGRKGTG